MIVHISHVQSAWGGVSHIPRYPTEGESLVTTVASLIPRLEKQKEGLVIDTISTVWCFEQHVLSHG